MGQTARPLTAQPLQQRLELVPRPGESVGGRSIGIGIGIGIEHFATFAVLYPQLQNIDFRVDVPTLQVPVYLVQGRYEARGRAVLPEEWFTHRQAPNRQLIVFDHSGHRPFFEEPARFHDVMTDTVLGQTHSR